MNSLEDTSQSHKIEYDMKELVQQKVPTYTWVLHGNTTVMLTISSDAIPDIKYSATVEFVTFDGDLCDADITLLEMPDNIDKAGIDLLFEEVTKCYVDLITKTIASELGTSLPD